ncbi:MAG: aminotransferase class V-fold PLP-dependent enzyme [Desulfobacteraceae bacterium]|nr:MAG: aminotransferase class V-fold PLP-dependent enzyme [Desulfobacteraceae bacterium]
MEIDKGRMILSEFEKVLADYRGPAIVCIQAGNVNTGAFDPLAEIIALCKKRDIWMHVDGASGLWAAASDRFRHLVAGLEKADSWATDAHKWLNVPYDSGMVFVRDQAAHRGFKTAQCAYAASGDQTLRDGSQWVPENSRRARGFVLYAALRHLGRSGVRDLVDRCCDMAALFAAELVKLPHVRILNEVILNQVLFRIDPPGVPDADAFHAAAAARIQRYGMCWLGTTRWRGRTALRISVSNSATGPADVQRSVQALSKAINEV